MATRGASKTAPAVDFKDGETPETPVETEAAVESEAAKASRIAPLDLSALQVKKVEAPAAATRGREARDNTVVEGWLNDLWATKAEGATVSDGLAITVLGGQYAEIRSRLLVAAEKLKVGVSISPSKKPEGVADDEKIEVSFAVKNRRKRKPSAAAVQAVTGQAPASE